MIKKHPADAADAAFISNATLFELSIFLGRGKYATETAATLDEAKAKAAELEAKHPNGKKAMIYALDAAGRRALYVEPHNGIPAFLKRDHDPL
jgi:hypothetical protein